MGLNEPDRSSDGTYGRRTRVKSGGCMAHFARGHLIGIAVLRLRLSRMDHRHVGLGRLPHHAGFADARITLMSIVAGTIRLRSLQRSVGFCLHLLAAVLQPACRRLPRAPRLPDSAPGLIALVVGQSNHQYVCSTHKSGAEAAHRNRRDVPISASRTLSRSLS